MILMKKLWSDIYEQNVEFYEILVVLILKR